MDVTSGAPLSLSKTRLAPTPSGYLHLGNIFSFVLTAALAEKYHARILLRIDDLDRLRAQREYVQDVFDTLHFMGIPWHEGPRSPQEFEQAWSQVHRMVLYDQALIRLRESGLVYACDCSRAQILQADPTGVYTGRCRNRGLSLDAPEVNWRLRTDADMPLMVKIIRKSTDHSPQSIVHSPQATDHNPQGIEKDKPAIAMGAYVKAFLPREQHDFVVRKKDGFPAYQLTSLIDDDHFGIDLIVRGTDLWPSTLVQHYLAGVLGIERFKHSTFYHHALLPAPGGQKLSKSAGDTSIQYLRNQGKTAAEVYDMAVDLAGVDIKKAVTEL